MLQCLCQQTTDFQQAIKTKMLKCLCQQQKQLIWKMSQNLGVNKVKKQKGKEKQKETKTKGTCLNWLCCWDFKKLPNEKKKLSSAKTSRWPTGNWKIWHSFLFYPKRSCCCVSFWKYYLRCRFCHISFQHSQ